MHKFISIFVLLVSFAPFAEEEFSAPSLQRGNILTVGVTSTPFPPYWGGSLKLPQGLVHDIAGVMEAKLGVEIEYIAFDTIAEVKNAIENGSVDLAIGYLKSSDRENKFLFSNPIYQEAIVGWISPDKSKVSDVSELKWACLKGNAQCSLLKDLHFEKVIEVSDYSSFYEKLNAGKVDALIGFYASFLNYFKNNNIENQQIYFDKRFGIVQSRFMVNGKNHVLRNQLDEFILSTKKEDSYDVFKRIYAKYNPQESIYSTWYESKDNEIIIRYSIPDNLFPYSYINEDTGQHVGYIHDFFGRLSEVTPLQFEYIPLGQRNIEDMLLHDLSDIIPVINKDNYNTTLFTTTSNIIDVKYSHIESTEAHNENIYAILDRFGYFKEDPRVDEFLVYDNLEAILSDLKSGKITHAYVNKYIVDNIIGSKKNNYFKVLPKGEYLDLDTKSPMLLHADALQTKDLLEEAFKLIPQRELDSLWSKYDKVEYQIGYDEGDIRSVAFFAFLLVAILLTIFISLMRKKIDGVNKKTELSEGQRRFLLGIIDNIPSCVCIRNQEGQILLTNRSFKEFSSKYYLENESKALNEMLDNGKTDPSGHLSNTLTATDAYHSIAGRHFHVVNQSIVHYVDDMVLFMTVLTDVTELKEREKHLETSVQQKKNFLAIISHELRTPISGILGLMELLNDRVNDKLSREILSNASASTSKLKLLVDDILDFSKLEAHQLRVNIEQFNLPIELCPLIRNFESMAVRKGLSFQFYWKPSPYFVAEVDLLRMSQILNNILSNAVKFTEVGTIICRVELSANRISFLVKDMGIGMDEDELKSIFDPFVQAQDNIARRYGGTGLGMSIVKSLVDLMKGEINITSAKDIGTSVLVEIPVVTERFESFNPRLTYQVNSSLAATWFKALSINHELIASDSKLGEANFYPDTIIELLTKQTGQPKLDGDKSEIELLRGTAIVVDDDPINRFLIKMQLDKLGVHSHLVGDGVEALEQITSKDIAFDVLITDCHMPGINGFELAQRVKNLGQAYSSIPIVACTADNSDLISQKAEEVKIDAILYKPYELADLYDVLKSFLASDCEIVQKEASTLCEPTSKKETWLSEWNNSDKEAIAQAVIDSLEYCLAELRDNQTNIKPIVHRLKGSAGALSLVSIASLCQELELDSNNLVLKTKLIEQVKQVLDEAKSYMDKTVVGK